MDSGPFGDICSSKKYLNTKTNKIQMIPGKDTVTGCGCRLNAKLRLATSHCPINKW